MIEFATKDAAAKGLAEWLNPLHSANGKLLISAHNNAEGSRIVLLFEDAALMLEADPNDDTVMVSYLNDLVAPQDATLDVSAKPPWKSLISKPFGWSWATVNQQGYVDGVLLSSSGVIPEVAVTVVASSFQIRRITKAAD